MLIVGIIGLVYRIIKNNRPCLKNSGGYFKLNILLLGNPQNINSRRDRIRTCGLYVPNVALYQAEPHAVIMMCSATNKIIQYFICICQCLYCTFFKNLI